MLKLPLVLLALLLGAALLPSNTVESCGRRWTYYSASPTSTGRPMPVLVLLHGAGGSGGGFLDRSGWALKAQESGFLAIAPSGVPVRPDDSPDFLTNPRVWNIGPGSLFEGPRQNIDDPRFILDLLIQVNKQHRCDPQRVYLLGHSNGAAMCYRLATLFPQRWAAIATVAGPTTPVLSQASRRVPSYAIFGTEDQILPLQGGNVETPWGTRQSSPVDVMMKGWARYLGYSGEREVISEDEKHRTDSYGSDFRVTFLKGHGHVYPAPDEPVAHPKFGPNQCEVPINDWIWEFLSTHRSS